MTIEEKAKDFTENNITCSQDILQVIKMGNKHDHDAFIAGAKWMLEKAADWIGDSVVFDKFGRPVDIENFRKVMEE